jgi:hypothetical protein
MNRGSWWLRVPASFGQGAHMMWIFAIACATTRPAIISDLGDPAVLHAESLAHEASGELSVALDRAREAYVARPSRAAMRHIRRLESQQAVAQNP